jgi:hypothetical protein
MAWHTFKGGACSENIDRASPASSMTFRVSSEKSKMLPNSKKLNLRVAQPE